MTYVRDHLSPGNIQLVVVGKLQLVESNTDHCTDLHVHGLLLWEGEEGRRGGGRRRGEEEGDGEEEEGDGEEEEGIFDLRQTSSTMQVGDSALKKWFHSCDPTYDLFLPPCFPMTSFPL